MKKIKSATTGGGAITVPLRVVDDGTVLVERMKEQLEAGPLTGAANAAGGRSGGGSSGSGSLQSDFAAFRALYQPEKLTYEAKTEASITDSIAKWLRPGYDAAIQKRQKLTDTYHAELDADAIARGMGASTYVTDVKSRQKDTEAADILSMESDYGATLAKYVSDAVEKERSRALEVAMFNSEREHEAYMQAYQQALSLFAAGRSRAGGSSGTKSAASGAATGVVTTTPENCERFVSGLTSTERRNIMTGATALDQQYRAELIASVGNDRYWQLIAKK